MDVMLDGDRVVSLSAYMGIVYTAANGTSGSSEQLQDQASDVYPCGRGVPACDIPAGQRGIEMRYMTDSDSSTGARF